MVILQKIYIPDLIMNISLNNILQIKTTDIIIP